MTTATRLETMKRIDDRLVDDGRYVSVAFLLEIGSDSYIVTIDRGRVVDVTTGPFVMPQWAFALRASVETWERYWLPTPPPGANDLFAMLRSKELRLEGDLHPFMANLLYFKALLASPRAAAAR